jgi:hydroxylaminobenzene mutase
MPHLPLDLLLLRDGALTLLASLLAGFLIPRLKNPRMGVGAHVAGLMNGVLLLVLGVLWPALPLGATWSEIGRWLMAVSLPALWVGLTLAAAVGATRTAPIAANGAQDGASRAAGTVAVILIAGPSLALLPAVAILIVGLFGLS